MFRDNSLLFLSFFFILAFFSLSIFRTCPNTLLFILVVCAIFPFAETQNPNRLYSSVLSLDHTSTDQTESLYKHLPFQRDRQIQRRKHTEYLPRQAESHKFIKISSVFLERPTDIETKTYQASSLTDQETDTETENTKHLP